MVKISISKDSVIPLYYQIKEDMMTRIENEEWKIGVRIPSEIALSKFYDVSRGTIRQSILELVKDGLLVRKKGKGTFVVKEKTTFNLQNIFSFTELLRSKGSVPSTKIINKEIIRGDPIASTRLRVNSHEEIIKIVRLRLADKEPLLFEENFLPYCLFQDIMNLNLENTSLYHLLLDRYNTQIAKSHTVLEPLLTNEKQAEYLQIREGSPSLLVDAIYFTEDNVPVLLGQGVMRGDRCRYFVECINITTPGKIEPQNTQKEKFASLADS